MSDILIVDDEADIRSLIGDILADEGHATRDAEDADGALAAVDEAPPDLLILDIWLQGSRMDGIEVLKSVKRDNPEVPVVIISGHGNIEIAVAAIKQGAYDFIEKPFNIDQLLVVVHRALEAGRLRRENAALRAADTREHRMIGSGHAMQALRSQLERVARAASRVVLTGPPGSGKEVAARYVHANSGRAGAPFVVSNAATIEPHLMEEVLFGRVREDGRVEKGLFDRAHGGTLFFDEVAEMPLGTQAKILRILLDQSFLRPGGGEQVRVDVRLISGTARDLKTEITEGRFREDLYHRLNVVPIEVPPLDARREDIPELARHFAEAIALQQGLTRRRFTEEALAALQTFSWPGNVRQLRNLVERLLILGGEGEDIVAAELLGDGGEGRGPDGGARISAVQVGLPLREARELFERDYLIAQINRFGGNISRTASFIGMERSALHRKLKSLSVTTATLGGARIAKIEEEAD
ncbi:MAG: sigma-54-dependent transcriptional regulator [Pikeienuella sp.]|uniref:nitrogen assimilation response regulator NtrX n=1 Tax=Pikeienuella sp. TaxID=2831957 RepID=UPI00391DD0DA